MKKEKFQLVTAMYADHKHPMFYCYDSDTIGVNDFIRLEADAQVEAMQKQWKMFDIKFTRSDIPIIIARN